jgi:hypothetical protein
VAHQTSLDESAPTQTFATERKKEEGGKRGGRGRVDGEEIGGRTEGGREGEGERVEKEWEMVGEREREGGRGRSCWREREKGFERNRGGREREGERGREKGVSLSPAQDPIRVCITCNSHARVIHSPLVNTAPLGHTQLTNETRPACKAQGQSLG